MNTSHHDVIVIGAGQAGLAIGHHLAQQGRRFSILDAAAAPAAAWRERWDSLRLFTPARFDSLPGKPFPGDPDHYPTRDEVVAYLTDCARDLPVHQPRPHPLGSRRRLRRGARGPHLHRRHQIADELAGTHEVHLSVGSRQKPMPQRILGRDVFRYLDAAGALTKTADTRIGRRMKSGDTLVGSSPRRARRQGVQIRPRAIYASGSTLAFADGTQIEASTVIWATGFTRDHSWIDAPIFDADGVVLQQRGVTPAAGLYFLGLPWMHSRGSALLGWVKDDAAHVAAHIAARPRTPSTLDLAA